jgi:predicted transcriptional regulator
VIVKTKNKGYMMKTYAELAEQLVDKNPQLTDVVENNPTTSYKELAKIVTNKVCTKVGRAEDQYVKQGKLIWAIIDFVNGDGEDELDY